LTLSSLITDPSIQGIVVTAHDVSEQKKYEAQLAKQAFYDSLTQLPNRALLRDRIQQAFARAHRRQSNVCLLFLDLDNFKHVNDSLGHQIGDELLQQTAERLKAAFREESTVARLGGDEFVVLLEGITSDDHAKLVAERLQQCLAAPFTLSGQEFQITASIGMSISQGGSGEPDDLLRDADIAMYRAKWSGKACHAIFDSTMQRDMLQQMQLEGDLRNAIDSQEFILHYQPIIDLVSGTVSEVEALVRWQHPTRGIISPADFIPIAERTGLIVPLGHWVLKEACTQVVAWDAQFPTMPPLVLSVNLSPRQFQRSALINDIETVLRETKFPASRLKLEITEGAILGDDEATLQTLVKLKNLGIKLAVDDFGTGYSSLSYLRKLPIDCLKIDRSFINDLSFGAEGLAIVRAIIAMAKSLGLTITAEGVETKEQYDLLKEQSCSFGQGYLFSRPIESSSFLALLRRGKFAGTSLMKVA
jgi:diguanylate cyclase (GGDEF)-like protein